MMNQIRQIIPPLFDYVEKLENELEQLNFTLVKLNQAKLELKNNV